MGEFLIFRQEKLHKKRNRLRIFVRLKTKRTVIKTALRFVKQFSIHHVLEKQIHHMSEELGGFFLSNVDYFYTFGVRQLLYKFLPGLKLRNLPRQMLQHPSR